MRKIWIQRHLEQIGIACVIIAAILFYMAVRGHPSPSVSVSTDSVLIFYPSGIKWLLVALSVVLIGSGGFCLLRYARERKKADRQEIDSMLNKFTKRK